MDLESKSVYNVLKNKGVKALYHANTVITSKTFLENSGLLSRKYIEDRGLSQTPQKSDEIDKKYEIWDDIFLDAINIGKYFLTPNKYGPILFAFDLNLLLDSTVPTLKITKRNPIYWSDSDSMESRYFSSIEEFDKAFLSGNKLRDGGCHITLNTINGKLPFSHLIGIQIDESGKSYTNDNNETRLITQGIIDYFENDLNRNSISKDIIHVKNDFLLRTQYEIMSLFKKEEFLRLFRRKI